MKDRRVLKHCEVYNTHATYTQWFLHSHHASVRPHDSLFFFSLLASCYQKLPQVGQKLQDVDSLKKKKQGERAQQTEFPF